MYNMYVLHGRHPSCSTRVTLSVFINDYSLIPIQVLPGRTHPDVCMDAQSGYLLVGTTIIS